MASHVSTRVSVEPAYILPPQSFLESERTLSERLSVAIEHPIRLFHVNGLGVSSAELCRQVLPSFARLPWDEYDAKRARVELLRAQLPGSEDVLAAFLPDYFAGTRGLADVAELVDALDATARTALNAIRPYRRRALARFAVRRAAREPLGWEIVREPEQAFAQTGDHGADYRRLERRFVASPAAVTDAAAYRALIAQLASLVDRLHDGSVSRLRIVCHQMGLVAQPGGAVTNAPEGIHQDGADYIVSALVLERRGIEGGESVVYGPDKRTEYLRHTLREGEGIFQADRGSSLWHWVTPVRPSDPSPTKSAVRNVLGYDLNLE